MKARMTLGGIEISFSQGKRFAKEIGAENAYEVSAKTGEGVNSLFEEIAISLHGDERKAEDDTSISLHKRRKNAADFYDDLNQTGEVDPEKINYSLSIRMDNIFGVAIHE